MAISSKYGKVEISGVGSDEPVFILRAQDQLATTAIELYRDLASSHRSPVAETVQGEIQRFKTWKGKRKLPD